MEINKLKVGQVFYDLSRTRMGNTMLRTTQVHIVRILKVAEDGKSFEASWNGNPSRKYYSTPSSWKAKKPFMVVGMFGSERIAAKAERVNAIILESSDRFIRYPKEMIFSLAFHRWKLYS